jgi:hypothetical protein
MDPNMEEEILPEDKQEPTLLPTKQEESVNKIKKKTSLYLLFTTPELLNNDSELKTQAITHWRKLFKNEKILKNLQSQKPELLRQIIKEIYDDQKSKLKQLIQADQSDVVFLFQDFILISCIAHNFNVDAEKTEQDRLLFAFAAADPFSLEKNKKSGITQNKKINDIFAGYKGKSIKPEDIDNILYNTEGLTKQYFSGENPKIKGIINSNFLNEAQTFLGSKFFPVVQMAMVGLIAGTIDRNGVDNILEYASNKNLLDSIRFNLLEKNLRIYQNFIAKHPNYNLESFDNFADQSKLPVLIILIMAMAKGLYSKKEFDLALKKENLHQLMIESRPLPEGRTIQTQDLLNNSILLHQIDLEQNGQGIEGNVSNDQQVADNIVYQIKHHLYRQNNLVKLGQLLSIITTHPKIGKIITDQTLINIYEYKKELSPVSYLEKMLLALFIKKLYPHHYPKIKDFFEEIENEQSKIKSLTPADITYSAKTSGDIFNTTLNQFAFTGLINPKDFEQAEKIYNQTIARHHQHSSKKKNRVA